MRLALVCAISFLVCFGLARWIVTSDVPPDSAPSSKITSVSKAEDFRATSVPAPERTDSVAERRQQLSKALAGDDPLASAGPALKWLKNASLEDLQHLASDPGKFPFPIFSGFQNEFRSAFFRTLMRRWLQLDPHGAWAGMRRIQEEWTKQHGHRSNDLEMAAAWVSPETVLSIAPLLNKEGRLEPFARFALMRLAERDAPAAREHLARIDDPDVRRNAEVAIAMGIAQSDPMAALAIAQQMGEKNLYQVALTAAGKIGPGMVRQVLLGARGELDDTSELALLLLRYPEIAGDVGQAGGYKTPYGLPQGLRERADFATAEERERILASYDTLPPGVREDLAAALASGWARTEPALAADWALAHAVQDDRENPANRAATHVFRRWVNTDLDAATAWWRALPQSTLRDALGTEASTFIAEAGKLELAMEMFRPSQAKSEEDVTAHLAQYVGETSPADAAKWVAGLPEGVHTETAMRHLVQRWYAQEPAAVAEYVESLPDGSRRDEALMAFIQQAANRSASGASQWVATMDDPKLRQKAAIQVYYFWSRDDAAAAQTWFRSVEGVDPVWHQRVMRGWQ